MENKFKFGDMVRCAETGEIFIVADLEKHENNIAVMCQSYARIHIVDENLLELIPHPDAARLDWFEENKGMLMAHPKQHALEQDIPDYQFFGLIKSNGNTLRECIDNAIEKLGGGGS